MKQLNIIHTVNAFAGAGKTYDAIRWALMEAATAQRKCAIRVMNQRRPLWIVCVGCGVEWWAT